MADLDDFSVPLSSGFRPVTKEEAKKRGAIFSRETEERLLAFMDEADRCRNRAAVAARSQPIQAGML